MVPLSEWYLRYKELGDLFCRTNTARRPVPLIATPLTHARPNARLCGPGCTFLFFQLTNASGGSYSGFVDACRYRGRIAHIRTRSAIPMSRQFAIVVFIAAAIAFMDRTASATCGDYLAGSDSDHAGSGQRVDHDGTLPSSQRSSAPGRCHGPQCRSAPTLPAPLTPAGVSRHDVQQEAVALEESQRAPSYARYFFIPWSASLLSGYQARIERPPRFFS